MRPGPALVWTIVIMLWGVIICTIVVQTPYGRIILNLLNTVSFFLGIVYMIQGGQQENEMRLGFGLLLVILAIGDTGLPQPLEAGVQLFLAIGGAFIRAP